MKPERSIFWTLRIATAMCLIGHGAFGLITKAIWCNYFGVVGIEQQMAYQLMPIVGAVDIMMGITLLVYPVRATALWLVFWGLLTASMRPLSGEPFAELVERAGNFGAPLALMILCPNEKGFKGWFKKLESPTNLTISPRTWNNLELCLRITIFLLLAGHGWLNLMEKKGLLAQYQSMGFQDLQAVAHICGLVEIIGAVWILIRPLQSVVLFLLIWKMATELFYPHWEIFEWVERGGSYGVLLALSFAITTIPNLFTKKRGMNESLGSQALYALNGKAEVKATDTTPAIPAVPNYDATTKSFNYRVNNAGIVVPSGNPYQLQF